MATSGQDGEGVGIPVPVRGARAGLAGFLNLVLFLIRIAIENSEHRLINKNLFVQQDRCKNSDRDHLGHMKKIDRGCWIGCVW